MVAGTQQQRSEEQEQLNEHPQPHPAPTAEEEALKRNTDCVYFLASPLTCKKGSECEYRHSEYARINPRDCYYWLNGSCLNPKCGFRHPPLDGLLGTQVAAPAGASVSSLHTPVPVTAHAPYSSTAPYNPVAPSSSSKPAVPCIFFQKGYCLKGDRCAFLHGPVPTSNKAQQATAANPTTGPPSSKKIFGAPEKYAQQQNILQANITKAVEVLHEPTPAPKIETVPPRNGMGAKRYNTSQTGLKEEVPRYKTSNFPPAVKGSTAYVSDEQGYHPAKDTDEHLRESSPGFDVLVDDELGDAEYYHGENQYGGQERRNGNEYNMGRSANYDPPADIDREMYRDTRGGYDSYDRMQGPYDWEQRRTSSERRGYSKAESPDRVGESDLRYRLSKHRRANGLRSVVNHDHAPDNHHLEERSHRSSSRRGSHQQESSLSSRLQGRIKLPGRSPVNDRDMEGSSRRPQISNSGRLRDRIKGRVEDEFSSREDRSVRDGPRKEIMDDSRPSFAGPRRLAELKTVDSKEHHVLRKRKALENHQQSEGSLSFEGPMPLSEILKRKRQAKTEGPESSLNKEGKDQKITKESIFKKCSNTTAPSVISPASNDEANRKEESKPVTAEVVEVEGKNEETQPPIVSDHEVEDGMIVEEEEHELEGEEQQGEDGEEYYYEQGDEGEYNYEDGENLGPEEEYLDDEDGDDFAKTIGVMSS